MILLDEVQLSSNEFKALSSDSRTTILKLLNERNYTLTELASKLDMSSPTVKQHLNILLESDLIELIDEGRKWKYYSLTRKGKKISSPESSSFLIILSFAVIGLVGLMLFLFGSTLFSPSLNYNLNQGLSAPSDFKSNEREPFFGTTPALNETMITSSNQDSLMKNGVVEKDLNADCSSACNKCNPEKEECSLECEKCFKDFEAKKP